MQVPPDEDEAKYIITECLFANMKQLELTRSLLCLVGGCIAGIVNATNVRGLLIFVLIKIINIICVYLIFSSIENIKLINTFFYKLYNARYV